MQSCWLCLSCLSCSRESLRLVVERGGGCLGWGLRRRGGLGVEVVVGAVLGRRSRAG